MSYSNNSPFSDYEIDNLKIFGVPFVIGLLFDTLNRVGWVWVSFIFGIVVYTLLCALLMVVQLIPIFTSKKIRTPVLLMSSCGLGLVVMFTFLCETVYELWGAEAFIGTGVLSLNDWLWFAVENIGGVLLLDMFDVYGIKLSQIEVNAAFWPSTLVFVFRTAIGFGILSYFIRSYFGPSLQRRREAAGESARRGV